MTVGDCVLGMLDQPVTPINLVAVEHMTLALIEKLEPEDRTFMALSNATTSSLQQPNFELSTSHEEINPSCHDVHAITGTGAGKRSAGACRCRRTTTRPGGLHGLLHFCLASNRHGAPLPPDVSHVPSASVAACKVAKAAHVPGARSPGAGAGGGAGGGGSKACWAFKSSGTCRLGANCRFSHGPAPVAPAAAALAAPATSAVDAKSHAEFVAFTEFKRQHSQEVSSEMPSDAASKFFFVRFSPCIRVFATRRWAFRRRARIGMEHRALFAPCMAQIHRALSPRAAHCRTFEPCLIQMRTGARLPCGRHGNAFLVMLLRSPTPCVGSSRATGPLLCCSAHSSPPVRLLRCRQ